MAKLTLIPAYNGTYVEEGTEGVRWVRDWYTEPRDCTFECCICGNDIEEWHLWTCLDGGEAAHYGCSQIKITGKEDR